MENKKLDILIVYSQNYATSASQDALKPFPLEFDDYNDSYEYFLEECEKNNLTAGFATSLDISGPGTVSSYWTFNTSWEKHTQPAESKIIFDKFNPRTKEQVDAFNLLTNSPTIHVFTNPKVRTTFNSKYINYKEFPDITIPTVPVGLLTSENFENAKKNLTELIKNHSRKSDFTETIVLKDEEGLGGENVYKFNTNDSYLEVERKVSEENKSLNPVSFVLQPFINAENGFTFKDLTGFIDLRVIVLNNTPIQAYIRIAKQGDFRANLHQGGKIVFLDISDIPKDVLEIVDSINKKLNAPHSIYALDFIKSSSGTVYFIEGNARPGIDWIRGDEDLEKKGKAIIDFIVKELVLLAK